MSSKQATMIATVDEIESMMNKGEFGSHFKMLAGHRAGLCFKIEIWDGEEQRTLIVPALYRDARRRIGQDPWIMLMEDFRRVLCMKKLRPQAQRMVIEWFFNFEHKDKRISNGMHEISGLPAYTGPAPDGIEDYWSTQPRDIEPSFW